jgi:hypothetical protein
VRLRLFSLIAVSHGMWRAYDMMKSRDMYAVFVALLRACEERHDATRLCIIAQIVASSNGAGFLMAASDTQYTGMFTDFSSHLPYMTWREIQIQAER